MSMFNNGFIQPPINTTKRVTLAELAGWNWAYSVTVDPEGRAIGVPLDVQATGALYAILEQLKRMPKSHPPSYHHAMLASLQRIEYLLSASQKPLPPSPEVEKQRRIRESRERAMEIYRAAGGKDEDEDGDDLEPDPNGCRLADPVKVLRLSVRAKKAMIRLGIETVGQLVEKTPEDLMESRNFGRTSLDEVRSKLAARNLKLKGD